MGPPIDRLMDPQAFTKLILTWLWISILVLLIPPTIMTIDKWGGKLKFRKAYKKPTKQRHFPEMSAAEQAANVFDEDLRPHRVETWWGWERRVGYWTERRHPYFQTGGQREPARKYWKDFLFARFFLTLPDDERPPQHPAWIRPIKVVEEVDTPPLSPTVPPLDPPPRREASWATARTSFTKTPPPRPLPANGAPSPDPYVWGEVLPGIPDYNTADSGFVERRPSPETIPRKPFTPFDPRTCPYELPAADIVFLNEPARPVDFERLHHDAFIAAVEQRLVELQGGRGVYPGTRFLGGGKGVPGTPATRLPWMAEDYDSKSSASQKGLNWSSAAVVPTATVATATPTPPAETPATAATAAAITTTTTTTTTATAATATTATPAATAVPALPVAPATVHAALPRPRDLSEMSERQPIRARWESIQRPDEVRHQSWWKRMKRQRVRNVVAEAASMRVVERASGGWWR
ncbi:MAG: hypothetical protein M1823_001060 [Watsoniomyces obsoletus]|nr:MAG: hypothetical protein M1823_001060 [Watsoniomyces obsoletus]